LVLVLLLLEERRVVEPVRDQGGLAAAFITGNDQGLVLNHDLVVLGSGLRLAALLSTLSSRLRWLLGLLLGFLLKGRLAVSAGNVRLDKVVKILQMSLVPLELTITYGYFHIFAHEELQLPLF
jgi:hypothetical protein